MSKLDVIGKLITHNGKLKLLSLVLAVFTYYGIRGATSFEVRYDIPVDVQVEEGIAILDQSPRSVKVTFRGAQGDLSRLDQKQIRAIVKAKATNPAGSEIVELSPGNVKGAVGVRVAGIKPDRVALTFDREEVREFPVAKPAADGTPLIGRAEIDYTPTAVTVRGPHRQLEQLLEQNVILETEPVNVDGRVKSFRTTARVLLPGEAWVSEIDPEEVTVQVSIVTETVSRTLTNIAVHALVNRIQGCHMRFEPAVVNVTLQGRAKVLDSIPVSSVMVFADCTGLDAASRASVPVSVHLPAGKEVATAIEPDRVDVVPIPSDQSLKDVPNVAGAGSEKSEVETGGAQKRDH
jgi:YbbR domain-containing protein